MQGNSPIYDFLLSDIQITAATKGTLTAQLKLTKSHVNSRGTVHGAVSATLADWAGGLAIATHGLEKTGASINIDIQYIGTANIGDTIEIESTANKVGRSMAFTTIKIYKLVNGARQGMVATASHTKYISQPMPKPI
jgi:acyl-coenzyme A thioesterase 13